MGLRIANNDDIEIINVMFKKMINDSRYKYMFGGYELTEEMIKLFMDENFMNSRIGLIIQDEEGKPIGFTAFEAVPCLYTVLMMARLVVIYIEPEHRGKGLMNEVLTALEYWGKHKAGCAYSNVGVSVENKDLSGNGYEKYEVMYMKSLEDVA